MEKSDNSTTRYFDQLTPTYSLKPYRDALKYLTKKRAVLLDVGCAEGSGISFVAKTKGYDCRGVESSKSYSKISDQKKVYYFSILDTGECKKLRNTFDYILLFRVLHHLVGRNIAESIGLEKKAIENCRLMLKKDGRLIISEPLFNPTAFASFIFYLKRFFSRLSDSRITLGGYWLNIGAPVVNYFSELSAKKFFRKYDIVHYHISSIPNSVLNRLTKRSDLIVVLKK